MCNTGSTNKKKPRCIKSVEKVISTNGPNLKKNNALDATAENISEKM